MVDPYTILGTRNAPSLAHVAFEVTDSTGSDEHNQRLSERRAGSVKDFLAAQGIEMNRMIAVGYGEYRPVASNDTNEGRSKNRRVEIVIAEGVVQEAQQ